MNRLQITEEYLYDAEMSGSPLCIPANSADVAALTGAVTLGDGTIAEGFPVSGDMTARMRRAR